MWRALVVNQHALLYNWAGKPATLPALKLATAE
jgi:hypothetical protein